MKYFKYLSILVIMWTTYIAIIILVFFFSFFIKIKFASTKKRSVDDVNDYISENTMPSSDLARLNEMKFAYLHFANFVLLEKRPFSEKLPDNADNMLITSTGDSSNKYDFSDKSDRETTFSGKTKQECYNLCNDDSLGVCNAWTFTTDDQCVNYRLTNRPNIYGNGSDGKTYGYIRRSADDWAIKDLSELPTTKTFFKETAKIVNSFANAPSELKTRASHVASNESIPYCYRTEPTVNTNDGNEYQKYVDERTEAIETFEKVAEYFLFMGNNNIADNLEFIQYAVGCTKILNEFYKKNNNNSFGDLFSTNFFGMVKNAFHFFLDYSNLSDSIYDVFYEQSNGDGFITSKGLFDYLYNENSSKEGVDCKEIEEEISQTVNDIFNNVDLDGDGKISLAEFEYYSTRNILENQPTKPELQCPSGDDPIYIYEEGTSEVDFDSLADDFTVKSFKMQ